MARDILISDSKTTEVYLPQVRDRLRFKVEPDISTEELKNTVEEASQAGAKVILLSSAFSSPDAETLQEAATTGAIIIDEDKAGDLQEAIQKVLDPAPAA